jgi:hypothetical protein
MPFSENKTRITLVAFLIAIITVLVYLPAFQNDFVNWDDNYYIYENQHIWSIDFESLKWMFTAFHASNWHPLTWLSHAVDYAVWGLNPMGHHLTSVLLHGLNTFVVVVQGRSSLVNRESLALSEVEGSLGYPLLAGAVTGVLFGVHPLHVESVAWVSERKDVLYAFFYLMSVWWYVRYAGRVEGRRAKEYGVCLVLFVLALLSKPMAVTLPLVLLILDVYPLGRLAPLHRKAGQGFRAWFTPGNRGILVEKVPFILLSGVSSVMTVMAQEKGGALLQFKTQLPADRIFHAFWALCFYILKIVWPFELVPYYPYHASISMLTFSYGVPLLLVSTVLIFCIVIWKRQRVWLTVCGFYIVTLLPVLGLVQVGGQAAADRYAYMASIGPFLVAGLALSSAFNSETVKLGKKTLQALVLIISLSWFIFLSFLSVHQIGIWRDSFALWNAEMKVFPDVSLSYRNIGVAHGENNNDKEALKYLNRAIELNRADPLSYYNRGAVYGKSGYHDKAIEDFQRAIELDPSKAKYHNNLGVAFGMQGSYQQAIQSFTSALRLEPSFVKAYFHRGIAYTRLGFREYALRDFRQAALMGDRDAREYLRTQGEAR